MNGSVNVTVLPCGPATDILGSEPLEYALAPPATLGLLVDLLCAKYAKLAASVQSLRFAVNGEFADLDAKLAEGDEVAIIPPVSGGDDPVELSDRPIEIERLTALVERAECGAVVTFRGMVRAAGSAGNPLVALEYTAYDAMALRQLERLREQALRDRQVGEVALVHRVGRLRVGETAVAVAVSAPHREEAFEACRWLVGALKRDVPIWKREIWQKGDATWAR